MLTLIKILNNWKLYGLSIALICALSMIVALRFKTINLEKNSLEWQGKYIALATTVNAANEMTAQQEKDLRLREQEAATAQAESQKRMDEIMNNKVPSDCQGAIDYGISKAVQFPFNWNNNIPLKRLYTTNRVRFKP